MAAPQDNSESSRYQSLIKAAADADAELKDTKKELDGLKQKQLTSPESGRGKIQATIDEVQSEVNLDQARSQVCTAFFSSPRRTLPAADLTAQINE